MIIIDYEILARKRDTVLIKKKRIRHLMEFVIPADHRVKIKESEQIPGPC